MAWPSHAQAFWLLATLFSARAEIFTGAFGWALQFDGLDDFVMLQPELPGPPCTVEFWVQPTKLTDGLGQELVRFTQNGVLLSRHSPIGGRVLLSLEYLGSQVWLYGRTIDNVKAPAGAGDMFHYAMVLTEEEAVFYVNGEESTRFAISSADVKALWEPDAAFPWILGARVQVNNTTDLSNDSAIGKYLREKEIAKQARVLLEREEKAKAKEDLENEKTRLLQSKADIEEEAQERAGLGLDLDADKSSFVGELAPAVLANIPSKCERCGSATAWMNDNAPLFQALRIRRAQGAKSCNGGQLANHAAFMPEEEDDQLVFETGLTAKQIRDARIEAHHVGLTLRCLTRGSAEEPAKALLVMYRNGQMIYRNYIATCPDDEADYPELSFTPWELGSEFDGGQWDEDLQMAVTPSNFLRATFDDVRLFNAFLSEQEMADLVSNPSSVRPQALMLHYTFDADDQDACTVRRLMNSSAACFDFNEDNRRVDEAALARFPLNSWIGSEPAHVPSPFPIAGAVVRCAMPEKSCAEVQLHGSDADGDTLDFRLRTAYHPANASLVGQTLRFCDALGGRRDVEIHYDTCDSHGACASEATGFGLLILHIFPLGPQLVAFQYLPMPHQLRLVFNQATNQPSPTAVREQLVQVSGLDKADVLDVTWEGVEGKAVRLLVRPSVRIREDAKVTLSEAGNLRDAQATSFPAFGDGLLEILQCAPGTTLSPGQVTCQGCGPGQYLDQEQCRPCRPGTFALQSVEICETCPRGRWQSAWGASGCVACAESIRNATTLELGATSDSLCRCPQSTFLIKRTTAACEACTSGLHCPGGNEPPLQAAGYFAHEVLFEDAALIAVRLVACAPLRCPQRALGTCPERQTGLACSRCEAGYQWRTKSCEECTLEGNLAPIGLLVCAVQLIIGLIWRMVGPMGEKTFFNSDIATIAALVNILANVLQALGAVAELPLRFENSMPIFEALKVASLSVEVLAPECAFRGGPEMLYVGSLSVLPCMLLAMLVAAKIRQCLRCQVNWSYIFSCQGTLVLLMYLSAARLAALPWQCAQNPDGSSSVMAFRAVLCWESRSHFLMLMGSLGALILFTVTPLAAIFWAVWVYPSRLQRPGGIHFMVRWRFAFGRFSAKSYSYSVVFMLRNLAVALVPVLLVNIPQLNVLLLNLTLTLGMAIQVRLFPWRTYTPNLIDAAGSIFVCGLLNTCMALLYLEPDVFVFLQHWITAQFVFMAVVMGCILIGHFLAICSSRKFYHIFLSHHKASAACLARWFKVCMTDEARLNIFLDSDDLNLDLLFNTVTQNTRNLVVLLTKDALLRPWCVGEIVCAFNAGVNVVCMQCNDFLPGNGAKILQQLQQVWKESEKNVLANYGIPMYSIAKALDQLENTPTIRLDRASSEERQMDVMMQTLDRCQLNRMKLMLSGADRACRAALRGTLRPRSGDARVVIISSWQYEARTCSFLVRRKLMGFAQLFVEVLQEKELIVLDPQNFPQMGCVVVLLTANVLSEPFTANALVRALKNFPEDVETAYQKLLRTVAMRFSAHASAALQNSEIEESARKLMMLLKEPASDMSEKPGGKDQATVLPVVPIPSEATEEKATRPRPVFLAKEQATKQVPMSVSPICSTAG
ncbi:unnamed protein product [Effrenium voratum]|nr:unnamed protein product [Effrenium voratum]